MPCPVNLRAENSFPLQCKCKGSNAVKIMDGMGCKNGGVPECPQQNELYCQDDTRLGPNRLMEWKIAGSNGCPCPDGFHGYCKSTREPIVCPNGVEPDFSNREGRLIDEIADDFSKCRFYKPE